jgi:hypothetical protein
MCSTLRVKGEDSHRYKARGKVYFFMHSKSRTWRRRVPYVYVSKILSLEGKQSQIFYSMLLFIGTFHSWPIGVLGFYSRQVLWNFFITSSRTALGSTQAPIQWVQGALSLGVKWPGREADHSHPSSHEVKEWVELYFYSSNTPSWRGAHLQKAGGQLYLNLYISLDYQLKYLHWNSSKYASFLQITKTSLNIRTWPPSVNRFNCGEFLTVSIAVQFY